MRLAPGLDLPERTPCVLEIAHRVIDADGDADTTVRAGVTGESAKLAGRLAPFRRLRMSGSRTRPRVVRPRVASSEDNTAAARTARLIEAVEVTARE